MKICEPAKLYLALSVLSIILGIVYKVKTAFIVWKIVFAALYTWILSIMCKKRLSELAWVIVLLPFIAIGSSFIYSPVREGVTSSSSETLNEQYKKFNYTWFMSNDYAGGAVPPIEAIDKCNNTFFKKKMEYINFKKSLEKYDYKDALYMINKCMKDNSLKPSPYGDGNLYTTTPQECANVAGYFSDSLNFIIGAISSNQPANKIQNSKVPRTHTKQK